MLDFAPFLDAPAWDRLLQVPNAASRLRRVILQLAVRGRLVPQDDADEPAQVLAARIAKERARRVKAGEMRKSDPLPPVGEAEQPFELPSGWAWTRLGSVCGVAMGNSPPGESYNETGEGVPLVNGPVEFGAGDLGRTVKTKFTTSPSQLCEENDLLLCVRGSTTGRTNIAAFAACIGRGVAALRFSEYQDYINYFVLSNRQNFYDMGRGSTFPSISWKQIAGFVLPLPPLAEQKRIVAKVDELMALCDRLDEQSQAAREARAVASQAALRALHEAADPEERAAAWERLCARFGTLFDAPEAVAPLRACVLQLAVQGRLAPQNPDDESAQVLAARIAREKARLVREKKLKKSDPLPPVTQEEQPFELPPGWMWTRLDGVSQKIHYGFTASADHNSKDIRMLRITDIQNNRVNWDSVPGCEISLDDAEQYLLHSGDILVARTGGTIGKSFLVDEAPVRSVFASYLLRVVPASVMSPGFIKCFLETPDYWRQLQAKSMGTGQPNVSGSSLRTLMLALPPLEEQKRIVAKVSELMAQCDALEAGLRAAQESGAATWDALEAQLRLA